MENELVNGIDRQINELNDEQLCQCVCENISVLRGIIKEEIPCERRENFVRGIHNESYYGPFNDEQLDTITSLLSDLLLNEIEHTDPKSYITNVLVPEAVNLLMKLDPVLRKNDTDDVKHETESIFQQHQSAPPVLLIVSPGNDLYEQLVVVEEVATSQSLPESTHLEDIIVAAAEQECIEKRKSVKTNATYECKICHKMFNNRQNISRHMIRIHHVRRGREVSSKTISCKEDGCAGVFASLKDLKTHLMQRHDFNFREDVTEFATWDDFIVWKKKFESTHNVSFVQHSGSKRWCSKNVVYYYCHKSGDYESQSKGQRKRHSCKVGFSCTATMKVTIDKETQNVIVYSCNDHYGHDV